MQNTIKRTVAASRGPNLSAADLRLALPEEDAEESLDLKAVRMLAEGRALRRAQAIANGHRSETARLSGASRPTFYQLLKQHAMEQQTDRENSP